VSVESGAIAEAAAKPTSTSRLSPNIKTRKKLPALFKPTENA
jgi:hypothetical protein